jgi:glucokinase
MTFIGLDLGGTRLKVLALSGNGEPIAEESFETADDGTPGWRERARDALRSVIGRCPSPARVGVAAPGLPARDGSCIAHMPGRLLGLEGLNWQHWLGLDWPVPVFNDGQAALLGECWLGAARGAANVVLLTLGTGVGGAIMVDGKVLRGHLGRAGHLGHVSLDPAGALDIVNTPGSLEDVIGEHNLMKRSSGKYRSTQQLVAAVRQGDTEAAKLWQQSVRGLAAAIVGFINVLDPELIVLGGGIADADEAVFTPLQSELDRFEWRPGGATVRIVKAALGRNAGAIGAACGAKLALEANL